MKKILLIFLLFSELIASAQNYQHPYANQSKYWFYRNRFINEFMILGDDPSVPVAIRVAPGSPGTSNPGSYFNINTKELDWGDGTIRLGHYLGVLGTEYALLTYPSNNVGNKNAEAINQTKKELVYAIKALERLDYVAETNNGASGSLNGFFSRNDVPGGGPFLNRMKAIYNLDPSLNFKSIGIDEMSYDQVNHLLIGMRLIIKLVPSGISYTDPDPNLSCSDIRELARVTITRIVDYMHQGGWIIKNPITGQDVPRGADARKWSYGFIKAMELINGSPRYPTDAFWKNVFLQEGVAVSTANLNDNFKTTSLAAISNAWDDICIPQPTCGFEFTCIKKWGLCVWVLTPKANCPCMIQVATTAPLVDRFSVIDHYEYLPLINKILFNRSGFKENSTYLRNFYAHSIDAAPCRGPFSFNNFRCKSKAFFLNSFYFESLPSSSHGKGGWADYSLFNEATRGDISNEYAGEYARDKSCSMDSKLTPIFSNTKQAEFHGIDYMLLYNLHQLYALRECGNGCSNYVTDYYPNYGNNLVLHNYITNKNPVENFTARSFTQDGNVVNGNLTAGSGFTAIAGSNVNFVAGNKISLQPGFTAQPGSNFHANIYRPVDNRAWEMNLCADYNSGARVNGDIGLTKNSWYEIGETAMPVSLKCIPNPNDGNSVLFYKVNQPGNLKISLFDMYGKKMLDVINEENISEGEYSKDVNLSELVSGTYIYKIESGNFFINEKVIIVK